MVVVATGQADRGRSERAIFTGPARTEVYGVRVLPAKLSGKSQEANCPMHKIVLVDLGWKIARLTVDSNPHLAHIEIIDPPTFSTGQTAFMRLQPDQALALAAAIQEHFTQTPGGHT